MILPPGIQVVLPGGSGLDLTDVGVVHAPPPYNAPSCCDYDDMIEMWNAVPVGDKLMILLMFVQPELFAPEAGAILAGDMIADVALTRGTASILESTGEVIAEGGEQVLYHYTTQAGESGILGSGEIWASQGAKNARHGSGQYFTDIAPDAIGGETLATTPAGKMSLGQLSSRLFRVPWNTRKLTNFVGVDVTGLGAREVAPNIWLVDGESALDVTGRIVGSGPTLP
jgi:hypothetical protein